MQWPSVAASLPPWAPASRVSVCSRGACSTRPGCQRSSARHRLERGSPAGAQFAYVKASEGTAFVNPDFASQYDGAYQAGLIRGAYHFALPNQSSGAAQASYFVANGGGWTADGRTLPGALDIEYNPYGAECYGLSQSAMVSWIASFSDTYQALTSVWPVIYTTTAWWAACTGNYGGFAGQDPLWISRHHSGPAASWLEHLHVLAVRADRHVPR